MYKAPPPEVSSEQFYETDESRGYVRGFSIQTVSPLPIGWAEHVVAEGHWGESLREYMRDYNHWTVLGVLCELLPQAENRVTLADEHDRHGLPVAKFTHSLGENDKANIAYANEDPRGHLGGCRRARTSSRSIATRISSEAAGWGSGPENSVVDSTQRAWGVPNLFIADGSVLPTQGSANPALAIMALSDRLASLLAQKRAATPARRKVPSLR